MPENPDLEEQDLIDDVNPQESAEGSVIGTPIPGSTAAEQEEQRRLEEDRNGNALERIRDVRRRGQDIKDVKDKVESLTKGGQRASEVVKEGTKAVAKTGLRTGATAAAGTGAAEVATGAAAATAEAGLAAGSAASVVGIPLAIGIAVSTAFKKLKDAFQDEDPTFRNILIGLTASITAMIFFIMLAINRPPYTFGPDVNGGKAVIPQQASFGASAVSHDAGLLVADRIDTITASLKQIEDLINNNPPPGADIATAKAKLAAIKDLLAPIQTQAHTPDQKLEAQTLKQYQQLVVELMNALYPGRAAAKGRVLALMASGRITTGSKSGCLAKKDLEGTAVSENMYNALAEIAAYKPIHVLCLVSGHRKYVGKSPSQGYPYCTDPREVPGGKKSEHCYGRAADLQYDISLENFLKQNKDRLHIHQILHEDATNSNQHLHFSVN